MKNKFVKIYGIVDATKLVELSTQIEGDVIIKRGKFSVDGKSILGIFSIGLTEGVTIEYPEDAYELDEFLQQFES